jgi:hypothetical protein
MKVRQNLYLDREVADALSGLAAPNGNKSRMVNDALREWLVRRAAREVDDQLRKRFGELARDLAILRRNDHVAIEAVMQLARYVVTAVAPLADADAIGRMQGRERYDAFIAEVGRRLGHGIHSVPVDGGEGGHDR